MISPQTFARYAAMRVPRYTSYPTAPHFSPVVDDSQYREWLNALPTKERVSIYIHIPFCRQMCWYCGCHTSVTKRDTPISRYVSAIVDEIRRVASELPNKLKIGHLHWGGGSPTLLTAGDISRIELALNEAFLADASSENAVEVDPRTLTRDVAQAFAASGVNRASVGVQSFDPVVQAAINREQSFETTAAAVSVLRASGISAVNFDLIYGLPHQTVRSCLDTIRDALRLNPDRFAVFGYAHVPSFKPHQRKIEEAGLPTPAERHEQAGAIAEALTAAGYRQIGLDHFAQPCDSLSLAADQGKLHRNFQGYTTDPCKLLLGFGASAIGRLPSGFVQNSTRIPEYQLTIAAGQLATARTCAIGVEDRQRGAIIESLMCNYRANVRGTDADLTQLERDGLIRRSGDKIEVPKEARLLVRSVAAAFDAYLPNSAASHAVAV